MPKIAILTIGLSIYKADPRVENESGPLRLKGGK
jgi:hypothetical protein